MDDLEYIHIMLILFQKNNVYENIEVNENTQPIGKVVSLFRDI